MTEDSILGDPGDVAYSLSDFDVVRRPRAGAPVLYTDSIHDVVYFEVEA